MPDKVGIIQFTICWQVSQLYPKSFNEHAYNLLKTEHLVLRRITHLAVARHLRTQYLVGYKLSIESPSPIQRFAC
jgi:hypothetical protein